MDNIFTLLNNKLPKSKEQVQETKVQQSEPDIDRDVAEFSKLPIRDMITKWQKDSKPEYTAVLLDKMKPTMSSAMHSCAPGSEANMSVKAAKLTLDALKRYDPSFGAEPSTYVFHNLKRLGRFAAKSGAIIPESESRRLDQIRVQEAFDRFVDRKNREPSWQELADITGMSKRRVESLITNASTVVSESSTLADDSMHDTVSQSGLTDDDYYEYVYSSVGPIDQKIMEWSSGLHGGKVLSNAAIAAKLHISPAAVSQRKARIQMLLSDARGLV